MNKITKSKKCFESKVFRFNGIKIDNLNFNEINKRLARNIQSKGYVCLVEASGIIRAQKDLELKLAINESLISIPDGAPLAWYGKLLGSNKIERIAGVELMSKVFKERITFRHFLLGDTDETIKKIIKKAEVNNPGIMITGYSPPFKNKFSQKDNSEMLQKIEAFNADLIWVSFGVEKQEKWMFENYRKLNKGIMFGVGAAFKFYIDKLRMPHPIFQYIGMTWISRFAENPIQWISKPFIERIFFAFYFIREMKRIKTTKIAKDQK